MLGYAPKLGDESCASPSGPAMKWFIVYLCFHISYSVCLLWLTKRMSAMWAQIATTMCLCLTNIFSMFPSLMGDSAEPMTLCQWFATFMAMASLWIYNLEPEISANVDKKPSMRVAQ